MNKRLEYISFLNVLSCIAVVVLHTNGCFWTFSYERYWITANIIESVMYFAVPIFFMITGATLIDYRDRYDTKKFFIKRIKKVVIPFAIWSLLGVLYMLIMHKENMYNLTFKDLIDAIMNTKVINIYWFFIPLISIYLSIPILAFVQKRDRKKIFIYLSLVAFLTVSFFPFLCKIFDLHYNNSLIVSVGSGYILYVVLGYLISHYDISIKQRYVIYIFAIIGLFLHVFGTYYLSMIHGEIIQTFKGYLNVPCVLYSIGIFTFFKYQNFNRLRKIKVIKLSQYSFSIYLMHYYVIDIITTIFPINTLSIIYRLFAPIIIIFVCIMISLVIRKIPYLKNILPK